MLSDELPNEYDVFGGNGSAPVAPLRWHLFGSMAEKKLERKSPNLFFFGGGETLRAHAAPYRRRFGFRIPGCQQQLCLVGTQRFRGILARGPPAETSLG